MKEKIEKQIDYLNTCIEADKKMLDNEVQEFKKYAQNCDAYQIATFVPGKAKSIEDLLQQIKEKEDRARMLVWMLKED